MKPENIVIVRHGQSEGNAFPEIRKVKPDYALNLTPLGERQSQQAGMCIKQLFMDEKFAVYCSPYFRTKQTLFGIKQAFNPKQIVWTKEDPRLREQEYGNLEKPGTEDHEEKRTAYGRFFYRYGEGESGGDVYDRCTGFLETLYRDFEKKNCPNNILIVCHGFTMRILITRWLHLDFNEFHRMKNPENCGIYNLRLNKENKYEIIKGVQYDDSAWRVPYEYRDEPNKSQN